MLALCMLLLPPRVSEDEPALPVGGANIYARLIRDVLPAGRPPRERECAEMLCGLLVAAPVLRDLILHHLTSIAGQTLPSDLDYVIDTEQPIRGKRDDLRVVGRDADGVRQVLFTVEIKVAAGIHYSGDAYADEGGAEAVSQLVNYDRWLDRQKVPTKAGFVVAPRDMSHAVPDTQRCVWRCLRWTDLARVVSGSLPSLPAGEAVLGSHFAGFVFECLAGGDEMTDDSVNFDDIAVIRAVGARGSAVNEKVDRLVAPIADLFDELGVGVGKTIHQKKVLEGHRRSIVHRALVEEGKLPYVLAGVVSEGGASLAVWVETSPKYERKRELRALCQTFAEQEAPAHGWRLAGERSWWDLERRLPLVDLLAVEDQQGAVLDFVGESVEDLRQGGFLAQVATLCGEVSGS